MKNMKHLKKVFFQKVPPNSQIGNSYFSFPSWKQKVGEVKLELFLLLFT